jgi:phosphotransferase system HPr (HPr) family protein
LNRIEIVVGLEEGLHTRPAGLLVELFEGLRGQVMAKNGTADITSMLSIMTLGVQKGETVVIETENVLDGELVSQLRKILEG